MTDDITQHVSGPAPDAAPVLPLLPDPDRPFGPPDLGLRIGSPVEAGGWTWFSMLTPSGLDGPPGVLQGGLAAGLAIDVARAVDPHRAPLHAVSARLKAPTRLDVPTVARVRPAGTVGWYEVEVWQDGQPTVVSTVELTGQDEMNDVADLVALAAGPPPPMAPDPLFSTCFVCGVDATHPLALRTPPAYVASDRLSVPWVPDERLASGTRSPSGNGTAADRVGEVSELIVTAALDCPSAWATIGAAREAGYTGALLGSVRIQFAGPVEVLDPVRVTAQLDAVHGRKLQARSAVIDSDGRVLAVCDALHVAVRDLPAVDGED
jgi:hypothetical protein